MSRPYYSEYVRHCLRFFCRNPELTVFNNRVDEANWRACKTVMFGCSPEEKEILTAVYGGHDTLADEVYNASRKYNINQNIIWDKMKVLEREIARVRGLVI